MRLPSVTIPELSSGLARSQKKSVTGGFKFFAILNSFNSILVMSESGYHTRDPVSPVSSIVVRGPWARKVVPSWPCWAATGGLSSERILALRADLVLAWCMTRPFPIPVWSSCGVTRAIVGRLRVDWPVLIAVLVMTACGPAFDLEPPPPSAIPQLEVDVEGDSTDTNALVELAAAYRGAERPVQARALLERGRALNPDDQAIPVLPRSYV